MFCPECHAEYREGFTRCPDCDADLVLALEEPDHSLSQHFIELVSTMNLADIASIRSIFDGNGVVYQVIGENFNLMRPLLEPVRFCVREDHIQIAQELLNDMNIKYMALG